MIYKSLVQIQYLSQTIRPSFCESCRIFMIFERTWFVVYLCISYHFAKATHNSLYNKSYTIINYETYSNTMICLILLKDNYINTCIVFCEFWTGLIWSLRWFTNGITKGTSRSFLQGHRETGGLPVLDHRNSGERKQNRPNYRQTASDRSPSQRPRRGIVVAASNFFSCKRHCLSFEANLV